MAADENLAAALTVCWLNRHRPAPESRDLLDALGLLGPDGQVRPSLTVVPRKQEMREMAMVADAVPHGHVDSWRATDVTVRPKVSTAPPGLRDYVPVGPEPGVPARGRRRRAA